MTKPQAAKLDVSPRERLLDAAERLLIRDGYAAVSTRRVAEEADLNHGLIHYYFGSMEELFAQVLERFTDRLVERQREMYGRPVPFLEKWRTAMIYLDQDAASGYHKLWFELQAMAWNRPDLARRVAEVNRAWRSVLEQAFASAIDEMGARSDAPPLAAIVSLVMTFNQGIVLERLSGVTEGHNELLAYIDASLSGRAEETT